MENFTPYTALAGGMLIGLSVTIMLLFNGRLTGISSILSELLPPKSGNWIWRLVFLTSMIIGTASFIYLFPDSYSARMNYPVSLLIIGGFLVGFGTRLGNGCTSGHGICGIARLSSRSLIATLTFMFSGGVTVYIIKHVLEITA